MKNKLIQEAILRGISMADNLADSTIVDLMQTGAKEVRKFVDSSENPFDDAAARVIAKRGQEFFTALRAEFATSDPPE